MQIRDLTSLDDCRKVVELEKAIWGYADSDDVVGVPILIVTTRRGGVLLGAFDDRGEMVGFVYSLPGLKDGKPTQWSHMLGVVPEVRDSGLGTTLKLAQRRRALAMGIELIEWTYDPLQALNAHLNFTKLGIVVSEYEENIYGDSASVLHKGTPTDRFVAEWWLRQPHVERRIAAKPAATPRSNGVFDAPAILETGRDGTRLVPRAFDLTRTNRRLSVEIPPAFGDMLASAPEVAMRWRLATRAIFTAYFARGYRAVDFFLDQRTRAGRYLLAERDDPTGA